MYYRGQKTGSVGGNLTGPKDSERAGYSERRAKRLLSPLSERAWGKRSECADEDLSGLRQNWGSCLRRENVGWEGQGPNRNWPHSEARARALFFLGAFFYYCNTRFLHTVLKMKSAERRRDFEEPEEVRQNRPTEMLRNGISRWHELVWGSEDSKSERVFEDSCVSNGRDGERIFSMKFERAERRLFMQS